MDFSTSKFDMKTFARKLNRAKDAGEPEERDIYVEHVSIRDLKECFLKMYSDLLKHRGAINIREIDFSSFDINDLEEFYTFLETNSHDIFDFGEIFLSFKPAVTTKPVFI